MNHSACSSEPKKTKRTSKGHEEEQVAILARRLTQELEDEDSILTQNETQELNRLIPDSSRQIQVESKGNFKKLYYIFFFLNKFIISFLFSLRFFAEMVRSPR